MAAGSVVGGKPYVLAYDSDVAELPAWLAKRLRSAPLPPQRPVTVALATDRRGSFLRAAITGELERITRAPDHHYDALYTASVALGQLVAGGALDAEATAEVLEHAGVSAGLKPRVLYLALEDTPRRLQTRMGTLLAGEADRAGLTFATSCPLMGQGGDEAIASWLDRRRDARMVVVDV